MIRLLPIVLIGALTLAPAFADNLDPSRLDGCRTDIDGDGDTDLADLAELLSVYSLTSGEPGFIEAADFDDNGVIDLSDLAELLSEYGCVGAVQVERMQFTGASFVNVAHDCASGNCSNYGTPHWLDANLDGDTEDPGDRAYPAAYVRGGYVSITNLRFGVSSDDLELTDVPVLGAGPDGLIFEGTGSVSGGVLTVAGTLQSNTTLPDVVACYDTFDIAWEAALDGATFFPAGVSSNRMYVTLDDPLGRRLESFFDISTRAAHGADSVQSAIAALWAGFADLHVENVRGEVLGYYRGVLCASDCTVYEAQGLVMYLNGQCGSWADLLMQCLRTLGISGSEWITIEPIIYNHGLLVRTYKFDGVGTSGCSSLPYTFNSPCGGPYWPDDPECTDDVGLAGQDNPNPASYFSRHFIVKINGRFYDPSYGAGPFTGTTNEANLAWEQAGIDGYHGYCGYYHAARTDIYQNRETEFIY